MPSVSQTQSKAQKAVTSSSGVTYELTTITPKRAQQILDANPRNRNLNQRLVLSYAREMKGGRWQENGDAIRISDTGFLLDGQHRLAAVERTGIPLRDALLVSGLPEKAQDTMDAGKKRTVADQLKINGVANYTSLAAVARYAYTWVLEPNGNHKMDTSRRIVSNSELLEFIEDQPELNEAATVATHYRGPGNRSVIGFCWWVLADIDKDDADEFMTSLSTGADLKEGNPILTLRNELMSLTSTVGQSLERTWMIRLIFYCWNKWRAEERLVRIRLPRGGKGPITEPR
jgi:hypothetical protein